jgi:hypothetical protein
MNKLGLQLMIDYGRSMKTTRSVALIESFRRNSSRRLTTSKNKNHNGAL